MHNIYLNDNNNDDDDDDDENDYDDDVNNNNNNRHHQQHHRHHHRVVIVIGTGYSKYDTKSNILIQLILAYCYAIPARLRSSIHQFEQFILYSIIVC